MIGDKLRERRLELQITQAQLASMTNIKKNTISNYENNISSPNEENILKLMNALKCDANYLFEWSKHGEINLSVTEENSIKKYRTLDEHGKKMVDFTLNEEYDRCTHIEEPEEESEPTFEICFSELPVSAGTGEFLSEEMTSIIEIPDTPFNRTADFVVQVSGRSMEPKFYDKDFLLVRKQPSVYEGEIGIFVKNGEGLVKEFGGDRLISINPDYDDVYFNEFDSLVCYGKVIGKI